MPEKTKLQAFYTKDMESIVNYAKETNTLHIDGQKIDFVDTAEHVGMLRSPSEIFQPSSQEWPPTRKHLVP
jgi:hypothetical protein